ncbi:MAG TPA: serine hydrolase domain-containing protein [Candidatus Eisenbacteria bacterium]|nr:serine hydrolase domain-containing protein [Candidatus Eisenbacteria bacterium]
MGDVPEIGGSCDARFAAVRTAFEESFRARGEVGAAVAVTIDGRPVVDLWGGWADLARTRPWRRDTIVDVFSAGKGMATLALLLLVDAGVVDLDAPVARYWPELAAEGKGGITVRTVLAHRAGLPAIHRELPPLAMYDWPLMTSALAADGPWWEPGSRHGYHVNTFGFLVGEIVRRASGERFGAFFRDRVAGPLGADFHFGIGPEHDERIADHLLPDDDRGLADFLVAADPPEAGADPQRRLLLERVYVNPSGISGFGTVNTRAWRAAEMPSTNGHGNARAVARIYAPLACGGAVDGVRLLRSTTIDEAIAEASAGIDAVVGRPSRFGLGFQLSQPSRPFGTNPRSFGHFGTGGSLGFADPDARLAFGYTMNLPGPRWKNPRTEALVDAVYASL